MNCRCYRISHQFNYGCCMYSYQFFNSLPFCSSAIRRQQAQGFQDWIFHQKTSSYSIWTEGNPINLTRKLRLTIVAMHIHMRLSETRNFRNKNTTFPHRIQKRFSLLWLSLENYCSRKHLVHRIAKEKINIFCIGFTLIQIGQIKATRRKMSP